MVQLAATVLLGAALSGCMTGEQYQAQKRRDAALLRIVTLKEPVYVKSKMGQPELLEITQLETEGPSTVGTTGAELWVIKQPLNREPTPIAPVSSGVTFKGFADGSRALVFPDGRKISVPSINELFVELCAANSAGSKCNPVTERVNGRVLANEKGPVQDPKFGLVTYAVQYLLSDASFTDASQVPAAIADVKHEVELRAQTKLNAEKINRQTYQTQEGRRIATFKKPPVGATQFCESVNLLSAGHPANSGTLFNCGLGEVSLGELRAYGWEVTSMTRRPDTGFAGLQGDSVSIAVKKVRKAS